MLLVYFFLAAVVGAAKILNLLAIRWDFATNFLGLVFFVFFANFALLFFFK